MKVINLNITLITISKNIFKMISPIWYENDTLYINILPVILILLLTTK